jgi:hypothetical protein
MHGVGRRNRDLEDLSLAPAPTPAPAPARVSVGLGLGLENGPRGKRLRAGEERAELKYRWPPVSPFLERELSGAYAAITGRRVWGSVLPLLILAARLHGPDTTTLLRELYQADGVQDLLARLIANPPRLAPHPDYDISTLARLEVDQPSIEADDAPNGGGVGEAQDGAAPAEPERRGQVPELPTHSATVVSRHADLPRLSGPEPVEPPKVLRPRPPDCPNPRHEPAWVQRSDGTRTCRTCHP